MIRKHNENIRIQNAAHIMNKKMWSSVNDTEIACMFATNMANMLMEENSQKCLIPIVKKMLV